MTHQTSTVAPSTAGLEHRPSVVSDSRGNNTHCGRNYDLHARNIGRVIQTMLQRLDVPMSNGEMAGIACLSPYHFNRVFHQLTGIPPSRFHYALRLQRAKHLLISTDLSITNICFEIGHNSLGTFVSRFGWVPAELLPSICTAIRFDGLARIPICLDASLRAVDTATKLLHWHDCIPHRL